MRTAFLFACFVSAGSAFAETTVAPEIDNFVSTKSRAEVRAETLTAIRLGQIARNDSEIKRLAMAGFVPTKTRAQVRAEAAEALRLGLIARGEADAPVATPEQLERIRMAGLRALETTVAQR